MEVHSGRIGIRFSVAHTMQNNAAGVPKERWTDQTHNIVVEQTSAGDKYCAAKPTPIDPNINCGCERAPDSMRC
jgi:hypothetical protein